MIGGASGVFRVWRQEAGPKGGRKASGAWKEGHTCGSQGRGCFSNTPGASPSLCLNVNPSLFRTLKTGTLCDGICLQVCVWQLEDLNTCFLRGCIVE